MKKYTKSVMLLFLFCLVDITFAQAGFSTSLHGTGNGHPYWYDASNGGFETLTGLSIDQVFCLDCHGTTDANGDAFPTPYTPGCSNCHATKTQSFTDPVSQNECLKCHSREASIIQMNIPDVHRTAGFTCMNCHKSNDVHGNGTEYNSMFDPGAIAADCSDPACHGTFTHTNPAVDPHSGKIHCTSCHASTNLSCYNCHFESQPYHLKRAQSKITGFIILVNRTKDNKVHPATFQSTTYQGKTWIAMGPSVAHTITKTGARTCAACHQNYGGSIPAITEYNSTGIIQFAKWNIADSTLSWKQGIVPLPIDYLRSFKLDYLTYLGNPDDPIVPSKNWEFISDHSDGFQLLFATPLTELQMAKIGMDTNKVVMDIQPVNNEVPSNYSLSQNYPNPFNPSTMIKYSVPTAGFVEINLYDALGKLVKQLVGEQHQAGNYQIEFNATGLTSGVYFYQIKTSNFTATKKLILMK